MCAANMQMIRVPNYVHELVCHLISCNTCCPDLQTRRQKGTIHVCTAVMCMCVCVCVCVCGAEVCARTHVSGYLVMSRISMIHMTMLQRFVGHHLHEHDAT